MPQGSDRIIYPHVIAGAQAEESEDAAGPEGEGGARGPSHHHLWDANPEQLDGDACPLRHYLPGLWPQHSTDRRFLSSATCLRHTLIVFRIDGSTAILRPDVPEGS